VYAGAAAAIDFFLVQFYNQGPSCYTTYNGLFLNSLDGGACPNFPGTSVAEIARYGLSGGAVRWSQSHLS
jgi:hypothetical protein